MSIYCIADLHGNAAFLEALLSFLPLKNNDTLYILGDVIDRGPDGIEILKYIMYKPNIKLLLGNHEIMMLEHYASSFDSRIISRCSPSLDEAAKLIRKRERWHLWKHNHNQSTVRSFQALSSAEREGILDYLRQLPSHIEVTVNGRNYYLVHGFPGKTVYEEVWTRPADRNTKSSLPDKTVICGHTPVVLLEAPTDSQQAHYFSHLERTKDIMRIFHSPQNWIDIDCGLSYPVPGHALGCLCLDNMAEIYITDTNSNELRAIVSIPTGDGIIEHEMLFP